jgi:hypothetical protein
MDRCWRDADPTRFGSLDAGPSGRSPEKCHTLPRSYPVAPRGPSRARPAGMVTIPRLVQAAGNLAWRGGHDCPGGGRAVVSGEAAGVHGDLPYEGEDGRLPRGWLLSTTIHCCVHVRSGNTHRSANARFGGRAPTNASPVTLSETTSEDAKSRITHFVERALRGLGTWRCTE